jgi:hypothetical protein
MLLLCGIAQQRRPPRRPETCLPEAAVVDAVPVHQLRRAAVPAPPPHVPVSVFPYDVDPVQFALNLEFTEAEFSLHAAFGVGLDQIAPELALGGPPPVGTRKVNLDEMTSRSFFDTVKVDGPPLSLSLGKKYIYISM